MLVGLVRSGNTANLPRLLGLKPALSTRNEQGNTFLHDTLLNTWILGLEDVKMLLEAGADLNDINNEGDTCLHVATLSDSSTSELLDTLVQAGADINAKNFKGESPLFKAVAAPYQRNAIQKLEMLLD